MDKGLNTLIRLHKFRVDEKRREIGGMITVIDDLERQVRELENQILEEQSIAGSSPEEAGILFGNYAAHYILKKKQFSVTIREMEEKLETAQEELREEYKDLKGVELTQEARDNREALEEARAEQAVLDEIGLNLHRCEFRQ